MRKLLYAAIGFVFGCGLWVWILPEGRLVSAMYAALAVGLVCLLLSRGGNLLPRLGLVLLGCGAALFWTQQYDGLYLAPAAALDGLTQPTAIRASDYSYETAYGITVDGTVEIEGKTYPVKAYVNDLEILEPGQLVSGEFRFRLTTPDAAEESSYHAGKGIFLLAYQRGEIQLSRTKETWGDAIARLRRDIRETLRAAFPADTYPFALALLLGNGTELDYATNTAFKLSGISHVIAVSGQHVVLMFALVNLIALRQRFLKALLGFPALLVFAALAGFTPSVVRACLMSGLMLLGTLLNKEYDGPTGLSFAMLLMLLANPLTIASASFQLSAGSVAGIYLFQTPIQNWILSHFPEKTGRKITGWFASSTAVTLSAMTVTTPLCALHFGTVSLVGVLTNLLTLWVISFVFYGILAVCLLALLSGSLASLLAGVLSWPIRYVLFAARILGNFPLAAVYTRSPYIAGWLVFSYLLLLLFWMMEGKRPRILACCGALGLCVALLASWAEPMGWDVSFTVLDVGQGQCLLLQSQGQTYMVDCGGDSDTRTADIAAETLLSQGISQLDGLILTHLDRDHAGAAGNLLSRVDTRLLILPPESSDLPEKTRGQVLYAKEPLSIAFGTTELKIFPALFPGNSNEMSLCILFDTEKCDILITGDRNGFGERSLLRHYEIPKADILVAGHHGSRHSTCEELLAAVQPELVCISVGKDNSYGHPAPELLQRLAEFGCTVYRTDQNGTITIRR